MKPADENLVNHVEDPDDKMVSNNFDESLGDDFQIKCNIGFVLLAKYDCMYELSEVEKEVAYNETENQHYYKKHI